jgi:hypothetical protein
MFYIFINLGLNLKDVNTAIRKCKDLPKDVCARPVADDACCLPRTACLHLMLWISPWRARCCLPAASASGLECGTSSFPPSP